MEKALDTASVKFDDGNTHKMELFSVGKRTVLVFNKSESVRYISLSVKELNSVMNFLEMYNGENNGN